MHSKTTSKWHRGHAFRAAMSTMILWGGLSSAAAEVIIWQDLFPVSVEAVAWSPDGTTIAVGGAGSSPNAPIELRDADTGAVVGDLPSRPLGTFSLDYSAGGEFLAAGGAFISNPDVPVGINDVFETNGGTVIA